MQGWGWRGFINGEAMERDAQAWIELCIGDRVGDDDEKGIGGVDEVNESDASVVFDGD